MTKLLINTLIFAFFLQICNEDVTLKCNADFERAYNSEPMDVEFVYCRYFNALPKICIDELQDT